MREGWSYKRDAATDSAACVLFAMALQACLLRPVSMGTEAQKVRYDRMTRDVSLPVVLLVVFTGKREDVDVGRPPR